LPSEAYLALNLSPSTIVTGAVTEALAGIDLARIVLEVTEQAPIHDYALFAVALEGLREAGLRLAVDDAGAGFASLRHVLRLAPDVIKLDRTLIEHVDGDRHSRALAVAFVGFAREVGATVLAEGIESEAQLSALLELGVTVGQGYLLGRPLPLA
jgi:EAL domain-containing protein (putative c-di-GMP-specific phosphodiesterase class I)